MENPISHKKTTEISAAPLPKKEQPVQDTRKESTQAAQGRELNRKYRTPLPSSFGLVLLNRTQHLSLYILTPPSSPFRDHHPPPRQGATAGIYWNNKPLELDTTVLGFAAEIQQLCRADASMENELECKPWMLLNMSMCSGVVGNVGQPPSDAGKPRK